MSGRPFPRCETNDHVWIVPPGMRAKGEPFDGQHCVCGGAVWSPRLRAAVDLLETRLVDGHGNRCNMSRKLDDLSDRFKPLAMELLARCVEARIAVMIVDTLRTPAEQAENIRKGVSWTTNSKHLTGDAIDLCPYEVWNLHGADKLQWNPDDPAWQVIGRIGETLGLRWGGRWRQKDLGHFEYVSLDSEARKA